MKYECNEQTKKFSYNFNNNSRKIRKTHLKELESLYVTRPTLKLWKKKRNEVEKQIDINKLKRE